MNQRLMHPRAITNVKDSVHIQIKLSIFDREIIDSAYFQRLHFVLQNSTTYVAFPTNKNSRFAHSLGVAHLAGEMLVRALSNSTLQDHTEFVRAAESFILEYYEQDPKDEWVKLIEGWKNTVSGQSGFRHSPFLTPENLDSVKNDATGLRMPTGFIVDTLWQTLRICGLVHDIGHLPFSHSLEGAVSKLKRRVHHDDGSIYRSAFASISQPEQFDFACCSHEHKRVLRKFSKMLEQAFGSTFDLDSFEKNLEKFPIHERRSLYIFWSLYDSNEFSLENEQREYRNFMYRLAFLILFSSMQDDNDVNPEGSQPSEALPSFFRVLKLLIAGSVDADRLDYTTRDGLESGSTIGQFDLKRVVDGAVIYRDRAADRTPFKLGFFHRSVSGIEQFFTERFQCYKYIIYHRTSARTEACVQELTASLITACAVDPNSELAAMCESAGLTGSTSAQRWISDPEQATSDPDLETPLYIFPLHDTFLINFDDSVFRTLLKEIKGKIKKGDVLCRNPQAKAILKNIEHLIDIVVYRDFNQIYEPFKNSSIRSEILKSVDSLEPKNFDTYFSDVVSNATSLKEHINEAEGFFEEKLGPNFTIIVNTQAPKIYDHQRALRDGEEVTLIFPPEAPGGDLISRSATEISSVLDIMPDLFMKEFKIRIYFVAKNIKYGENIEMRNNVILAFREYAKMLSSKISEE
ncbi:MAG: hypothetical protein AAF393_10380 [Pseudomonadota bacterium]